MATSVDATNPQYDARVEQWQTMRDAAAGEDAVKAAGKAYLPMLGGQDAAQYDAYKARASYYNATGRSIDGLSGMVFRKPPLVTAPTAMADFQEDVTLEGVTLHGFAEMAVEEVLTVGRTGVLVEYPEVGQNGLTQAQADRMNLRPFWSLYKTEAILNWRVGQVGNRTELMQVRLLETVQEPVEGDEFGEQDVAQIRVLEMAGAEDGDDGALRYQQRIFRKSEDEKSWEQFGEPIVPTMNGQPMDYIPFIFLGPRDTSAHVCKPPLMDLAYVNLSHYRTCADLEHGAHFTALPTPYVFGVKENEVPNSIGPETIWTSENGEVKAGLLEFQGQGLEALEKRREVKEQQMASLGARMLAPERRMVEAAETAAIHRQGEMSVLASLAQAIAIGITQAMEIARDWMQQQGDVRFELNTDYLPARMTAQELTALFAMVQGGRISQRTFFYNLQEGEIIEPGKSFEEEEADREADEPVLAGMVPPGDGSGEDEDEQAA